MRSRSRILACMVAAGCLLATMWGISYAEPASIVKMPVNNRIWEVYETNPLTAVSEGQVARVWVSPNGASIAYVTVTPEASRLCVKSAAGGKASVIAVAGRDPGATNRPDGAKKTRWDLDQLNLVWSADSRLVAFPVFDDEPVGESARTKDWTWIVTFTASGEQKSSFPLPRALELVGDIRWSQDVRKIAMVVKPHTSSALRVSSSESKDVNPVTSSIFLLDLFAGSAQPIYTEQGSIISLVGWSKGGKALQFTSPVANGDIQLQELDLASGKATPIDHRQAAEIVTQDWDYRLITAATGLVLENRQNSKRFAVCRDASARFIGWTPNGLAVLSRAGELADDTAERRNIMTSLWLSRPLQMGVNSMCLALDYDAAVTPTFSKDCSVAGFVSGGRLWAVRINRRDASLDEKAAYRMVLNSQEEKTVALTRAAEIAKALSAYMGANEGRFPGKDTVAADLKPYLRDPQAFNKPGSLQRAFNYNPPDTPALTGRTMDIGSFDPGGSWRIIISSDSKTRMEGR